MGEEARRSIDRLATLWEKRYSRHLSGGQHALRGFDYQLTVAVRDALRGFLESPDEPLDHFVERLSDIVSEAPGGGLVVTQVKLTGRSLNSQLNELWLIDRLATAEMPEVVADIRYKLACSVWELKDRLGALSRWRPDDAATGDLESFKSRVELTSDPDPFREAVSLAANVLGVADPYSKVTEWIGRVAHGASGYEQLWSEFLSLGRSHAATAATQPYMLTPLDRPPEAVLRGSVLTGERPKLPHLRGGYFMPRRLFSGLTNAFNAWLDNEHEGKDPARHPVFWIGGRSGSGKSVALLHLAARLDDAGAGPVFWVGNGSDLAARSVTFASVASIPGQRPILAIDDGYDPLSQGDRSNWRSIIAALDNAWLRKPGATPVMVCCGPTEQAHRLQQDFPSELDVHIEELPHEPPDRHELEKWYEQRTGKQAPHLGSGDVLIVQLFFEWWTGQTLPQFSRSFRIRIEQLDESQGLLRTLEKCLALNSIYCGFPSSALDSLSAGERDALSNLLRDGHFSIDESEDRPGVWFSHPHLASVIFTNWFPPDESTFRRTAVLSEAVTDCLRMGPTAAAQTAALLTLARLDDNEARATGRFSVTEARAALRLVYALVQTEVPTWSLTVKAAWARAVLDAFDDRPVPDPVSETLIRLKEYPVKDEGCVPAFRTMLNSWNSLQPDERELLTGCVMGLWREYPNWSGSDDVVTSAIPHISDVTLREASERRLLGRARGGNSLAWLLRQDLRGESLEWLLDLSNRWVAEFRSHRYAGRMFGALLRHPGLGRGRRQPIATLAYEWANAYSPDPVVEAPLTAMLKSVMPPQLRLPTVRLALDYLESQGVDETSSFLFGGILGSGWRYNDRGEFGLYSLAVRASTEWATRYTWSPGARFVVERLLGYRALSDRTWLNLANTWVDIRCRGPINFQTSYALFGIWQRGHLLDQAERTLLESVTRAWLEKYGGSKNGPHALVMTVGLAHALGDPSITGEMEASVERFQSEATKASKAEFRKYAHAHFLSGRWPRYRAAKSLFDRLSVFPHQSAGVGSKSETPLELSPRAIARRLRDVTELLERQDYLPAGFEIVKLLPAADATGPAFAARATGLAQRVLGGLTPVQRCGFALEADETIAQGAWRSSLQAHTVLAALPIETPGLLEAMTRAAIPWDDAAFVRALALCEDLAAAQVLRRPGLYLPALLVSDLRLSGSHVSARVAALANDFVGSAAISEADKQRLALRTHSLAGHAQRQALRPYFEQFGLHGPWLSVLALQDQATEDEVRKLIPIVNRLVSIGDASRAMHLLNPLLRISAHGSVEQFQLVIELAARTLNDAAVRPSERDGFGRSLRQVVWPKECEGLVEALLTQVLKGHRLPGLKSLATSGEARLTSPRARPEKDWIAGVSRIIRRARSDRDWKRGSRAGRVRRKLVHRRSRRDPMPHDWQSDFHTELELADIDSNLDIHRVYEDLMAASSILRSNGVHGEDLSIYQESLQLTGLRAVQACYNRISRMPRMQNSGTPSEAGLQASSLECLHWVLASYYLIMPDSATSNADISDRLGVITSRISELWLRRDDALAAGEWALATLGHRTERLRILYSTDIEDGYQNLCNLANDDVGRKLIDDIGWTFERLGSIMLVQEQISASKDWLTKSALVRYWSWRARGDGSLGLYIRSLRLLDKARGGNTVFGRLADKHESRLI